MTESPNRPDKNRRALNSNGPGCVRERVRSDKTTDAGSRGPNEVRRCHRHAEIDPNEIAGSCATKSRNAVFSYSARRRAALKRRANFGASGRRWRKAVNSVRQSRSRVGRDFADTCTVKENAAAHFHHQGDRFRRACKVESISIAGKSGVQRATIRGHLRIKRGSIRRNSTQVPMRFYVIDQIQIGPRRRRRHGNVAC